MTKRLREVTSEFEIYHIEPQRLTITNSGINLVKIPFVQAYHDDLSLADLLRGEIDQVLAINFMVELDWLMLQFEVGVRYNVKLTLVHQFVYGEETYPNLWYSCFGTLKFQGLIIPRTQAFFIIHKDTTAQLHIFTANLIQEDWMFKTQAIWSSPILLRKSDTGTIKTTEFENDILAYFAGYNGLLNTWSDRVKLYDFSGIAAKLVASVPGIHKFSQKDRFGHLRLRSLISKCQLNNPNGELILQCSSVGGFNEKWLKQEFGLSLRGGNQNLGKCSFVYPSVEQVTNSFQGISAGGSLPYPKSSYDRQRHFLDKLLCKWQADDCHRSLAMPHCKTYALVDSDNLQLTKIHWYCLTSANVSQAAWGSLQKQNTQLLIRSFELGVLIYPDMFQRDKNDRVIMLPKQIPLENNEEIDANASIVVVKIPFDVPLTRYNFEKDQCWTRSAEQILE